MQPFSAHQKTEGLPTDPVKRCGYLWFNSDWLFKIFGATDPMRECCALHDDLYPDARPSNFRELRALRKKRRERHEKNPLTITTDQENQRLADRRFYECMLHRADQGKTKSRRVGMKLQAKLYYGIVRSAGWIFY